MLVIELRRSPAVALIPVMLGVMVLSPIGQHLTPVALWTDRSADIQSALQGFGPFAAGLGAWAGGRDHRRGLDDLLVSTPTSPVARRLTAWLASAVWVTGAYALVAAVVLAVTAFQATWGAPVVGPPLVGFCGLLAWTSIGFAIGDRLGSPFVAPLVATGTFVVLSITMSMALTGHSIAYLTPLYPSIGLNASVWFKIRPDLSEIQVAALLGFTVVSLATLAQRGRSVSVPSAAAISLGAALAATAVLLAATSHADNQGVVVPALHSATTDALVPYSPVCISATVPVCLHPAYRDELPTVTDMVNALVAPVAGLSGAPVGAEQMPANSPRESTGRIVNGRLVLPPFALHGAANRDPFAKVIETQLAIGLVSSTPRARLSEAQQAMALFLVRQAGDVFDDQLQAISPAARVAEARFAKLTLADQRTWLASHYVELRDGQVSLGDLP